MSPGPYNKAREHTETCRFRLAAALALSALSGLAPAQDLGAAWFFERGRSLPVVLAPIGKVHRPFGLAFDLDASLLVRPLDGVRLGGSLTAGFKVADNAWLTLGVGGLFAERFEWSSVRPGIVLGVAVRF